MHCVLLDPGVDGCRAAYLRALTGADELAAGGGAVALLDRLLVDAGRTAVAPGAAARLPMCDRDRILAHVYRDLFGDRIEADAGCPACGIPFAVQFSLDEVMAAEPRPRPDGIAGPDDRGVYDGWGVRFRLPSIADLAAAAVLPAADRRAAVLAACVVAGEVGGHADAIEAAMAALGPALDADLDARCPHCTATAVLRFDIGSFLIASLGHEARFLRREAHRIACTYGWSYAEIMALPRDERRGFVRLIDGDRGVPQLLAAE